MDFELTEDQQLLQQVVRDFATQRVAPLAAEIDENHRYPEELVAEMAEMGLLGVTVPEVYGGAEMDTISYVIAMEEISRACASTGGIFDTYAMIQGVDRFIPVDVYMPGCPPRPETLIDALMKIQELVSEETVRSHD